MRKMHAALGIVAITGLFAVACGGSSAPPKEDFPALGQPAKLKILSPGDGTKAPLRWKAVKGAGEKLSLVLDTNMEITAAGQTMPMKIAMRMDMDGRVRDVSADGSATIAMTVTDASIDMPGAAGAGDMVRDMMKGMTIESTMDPRGTMSGTKVSGGGELMAQLGDQMNNSLDQMAIPFPEEPVGVGSKWQALTTQEANSMKVRMVATYELTKLEGDKGTVKMTIEQFADKQTINMNGTSAELKSLKSSGGGEMTFDLTRPMLAKADITLKMDAEMEVMGQSAEMKVDAKVTMTPQGPLGPEVAPAPAPEPAPEVAPEVAPAPAPEVAPVPAPTENP